MESFNLEKEIISNEFAKMTKKYHKKNKKLMKKMFMQLLDSLKVLNPCGFNFTKQDKKFWEVKVGEFITLTLCAQPANSWHLDRAHQKNVVHHVDLIAAIKVGDLIADNTGEFLFDVVNTIYKFCNPKAIKYLDVEHRTPNVPFIMNEHTLLTTWCISNEDDGKECYDYFCKNFETLLDNDEFVKSIGPVILEKIFNSVPRMDDLELCRLLKECSKYDTIPLSFFQRMFATVNAKNFTYNQLDSYVCFDWFQNPDDYDALLENTIKYVVALYSEQVPAKFEKVRVENFNEKMFKEIKEEFESGNVKCAHHTTLDFIRRTYIRRKLLIEAFEINFGSETYYLSIDRFGSLGLELVPTCGTDFRRTLFIPSFDMSRELHVSLSRSDSNIKDDLCLYVKK